MTVITITMTVDPGVADDDDTGLTAEAFDSLYAVLTEYGTDIEIERKP